MRKSLISSVDDITAYIENVGNALLIWEKTTANQRLFMVLYSINLWQAMSPFSAKKAAFTSSLILRTGKRRTTLVTHLFIVFPVAASF